MLYPFWMLNYLQRSIVTWAEMVSIAAASHSDWESRLVTSQSGLIVINCPDHSPDTANSAHQKADPAVLSVAGSFSLGCQARVTVMELI